MAIVVVATAFGGPEVLEVREQAVDAPGPGQILVDIRAAGTNPIDCKLYSGTYGNDPSRLPMLLGLEASGVVREAGRDAVGPAGPINVGDDVVLYPVVGAYASQIVVAASAAVPKPPTLTFEEASGLMLAGSTAVHALTAVGASAGDTLVIHGAAGGVGLMAVQLAVNDGVRVIGTASEGSHASLREVGAEPVTYGDGLLERIVALAPKGVDVALDFVGSDEAIEVSLGLVDDRDRIATIVSSPRSFDMGLKVLGMAPGADPGTEVRDAARVELARQAGAGRLRVQVAATYPLSEAASAHRDLLSGHTHGKIVLVP